MIHCPKAKVETKLLKKDRNKEKKKKKTRTPPCCASRPTRWCNQRSQDDHERPVGAQGNVLYLFSLVPQTGDATTHIRAQNARHKAAAPSARSAQVSTNRSRKASQGCLLSVAGRPASCSHEVARTTMAEQLARKHADRSKHQ